VLLHTCRYGALIPHGASLCSTFAAASEGTNSRHMQYNRTRRNSKAAAFYVSGEWRPVRANTLRLYDGLDIYAYYIQHRIATADMVHHIIELDEDWSRRIDMTNLLPLSNQNHGIISALYEKDEATKRQTQQLLFGLIASHWKDAGGIEKVLLGGI